MKNFPSIPSAPLKPKKQIGYIEEYCVKNGRYYEFAGTRGVLGSDSDQLYGSEYAIYLTLDADLEIKRSFSKTRILKKGTEVKRMVWPLEGREL